MVCPYLYDEVLGPGLVGGGEGGLEELEGALHEMACDTRFSDEQVLYHYLINGAPMVCTLCLGRCGPGWSRGP